MGGEETKGNGFEIIFEGEGRWEAMIGEDRQS
jgi:hypothetical protein